MVMIIVSVVQMWYIFNQLAIKNEQQMIDLWQKEKNIKSIITGLLWGVHQ